MKIRVILDEWGCSQPECALTGDLKIVRMDHCTSPASGNLEIFLLVERVTKRNIKVRFYELDDDGEEVWAADGRFTELDVHHQYAIVFRTPPYKDVNITSRVNVFVELVRPSDNARSEPRDFTYKPCDRPGAKRPRSSMNQSPASSFNSNELPTTLTTAASTSNVYPLPNANSWNQSELITEEQLQRAMNDYSSDEFDHLFDNYQDLIPDLPVNSVDGSKMGVDANVFCGQMSGLHIGGGKRGLTGLNHSQPSEYVKRTVKSEVSHEDYVKAKRTYDELRNLVKTEDAQQRAPEYLAHYLDDRERRNNALHVFIAQSRKEEVSFLLKMMVVSRRTDLANVPNADSDTPLHIAVLTHNDEFLSYLLVGVKANPLIQNAKGQTVLHYAIQMNASPKVFELLMSHKESDMLIEMVDNGLTNLQDSRVPLVAAFATFVNPRQLDRVFITSFSTDGNFPLSFAIEKRNMTAFKMLCRRGVQINKQHSKSGFTALRFAVEDSYMEAVQLLLEQSDLEWELQFDYQGISPFEVAMTKTECPDLVEMLHTFLESKGITPVVKVEVEENDDEDDEDGAMIIDEEMIVKQEVDVEELYANVKHLTETALEEVSSILDQSGKFQDMAELLDMGHLLHSGVISTERSISRNLLLYATKNENISILEIRNFLEILDEHSAVTVLDKMARSTF